MPGLALEQVGRIWVDTRFARDRVGPSVLRVEGAVHYRFMDFFYLPHAVADLDPTLVAEVCDLRERLVDLVVDQAFNARTYETIAAVALRSAGPVARFLDFGCGDGAGTRWFEGYLGASGIGVDMRSAGTLAARRRGVEAHEVDALGHGLARAIDGRVPLVVMSFVLHFGLPVDCAARLAATVAPEGVLVANVYGEGARTAIRRLSSSGFSPIHMRAVGPGDTGHRVWAFRRTDDQEQ